MRAQTSIFARGMGLRGRDETGFISTGDFGRDSASESSLAEAEALSSESSSELERDDSESDSDSDEVVSNVGSESVSEEGLVGRNPGSVRGLASKTPSPSF